VDRYGHNKQDDERFQERKPYIHNQKYSPTHKQAPVYKKSIKEELME
jgi:hypothetical protein